MTDDAKPDLPIGAVGYAMLLGAPIVLSRLRDWEYTFCEDCENWTGEPGYNSDGECKDDESVGWFREINREDVRFMRRGPPWPGCRGFKLRDGAPGPTKRWMEATKKKEAKP